MFQDRNADDFPGVDFPSNWRTTLSMDIRETQTDDLNMTDAEIQAVSSEDRGTQTVDDEDKSKEEPHQDLMNKPSLVKFMTKAAPLIITELDAALRSRAFDGYSLIEDEQDKQVRRLYTLDNSKKDGVMVSGVTWSNAGSVIAVAYEHTNHDDWCDHETTLAIWNINRRDFDPCSPFQQFTVPSCLTIAKFHPRHPGFIVAGGYTGEIYLWSITKEGDPLIATSSVETHREKITGLLWILDDLSADAGLRGSRILSSALDGKIILWEIDLAKQTLTPAKTYLVTGENLPRSIKSRAKVKAEVGITCLALNYEDPDIIMIGTEPGPIFQGSLMTDLPATTSDDLILDSDNPPKNPITVMFGGHKGRVVDIKCSPYKRDIFMSVGSDQEIRIYSLLQPHAPVLTIHQEDCGVCQVDWSWSRPMAFASAIQNNTLQLHDLMTSSCQDLAAAEKPMPHLALTSVSFNPRERSLLATGDGHARVHVWKLTEEYTSGNATAEIAKMERLLLNNDD